MTLQTAHDLARKLSMGITYSIYTDPVDTCYVALMPESIAIVGNCVILRKEEYESLCDRGCACAWRDEDEHCTKDEFILLALYQNGRADGFQEPTCKSQ